MISSSAAASFGREAEGKVAEYYRRAGYRIEATNFRTRFGEIDVIAAKQNTLVFIEVKARASSSIAAPCEFVTGEKQRRIILAAQAYLQRRHDSDSFVRFDVAEVTRANGIDTIHCIENAFTGE